MKRVIALCLFFAAVPKNVFSDTITFGKSGANLNVTFTQVNPLNGADEGTFVNTVSTLNCVGQGITCTDGGNGTFIMTVPGGGGGGSGTSSLAVSTGSAQATGNIISSPTAILVFSSGTFLMKATGGATAFMYLDYSSVTAQGDVLTLLKSTGVALSGLQSAFTLLASTTLSQADFNVHKTSADADNLNFKTWFSTTSQAMLSTGTAIYQYIVSNATNTNLLSSSPTWTGQLIAGSSLTIIGGTVCVNGQCYNWQSTAPVANTDFVFHYNNGRVYWGGDATSGAAGSTAFGAITTGNNTSATMSVDSGAQITVTTGGIVQATELVPFVRQANRLVDYWFSDVGADTLIDHSSSAFNGTFGSGAHAPTWSPKGYLNFDLTKQQYVTIQTGTWWPQMKTMTIAFKVDASSGGQQQHNTTYPSHFLTSNDGSGEGFSLFTQDNVLPIYSNSLQSNGSDTISNRPATGWAVWTFVFGSPMKIYYNGNEVDGYTEQQDFSSGKAGVTEVMIGGYDPSPNSLYDFSGSIGYLVAYSVAQSSADIKYNATAIRRMLESRGISLSDGQSNGAQLVFDGDSRMQGSSLNSYWHGIPYFTQQLLPLNFNELNLAHNTYDFDAINGHINSGLVEIGNPRSTVAKDYPLQKKVVVMMCGVNDFSLGYSSNSTYNNMNEYMVGVTSQGYSTVLLTELYHNTNNLIRKNYNDNVRTQWAASTLSAIVSALADVGNDPVLSTDTLHADIISVPHPNVDGNRIIASYVAPAVMKAMGQGIIPIYNKYVFSVSAGSWTYSLSGASGTFVWVTSVTAASSQSVPFYALSAGYRIASMSIRPVQAFSGSGYTSFNCTVGDDQGGAGYYMNSAQDLTAIGNTLYKDYIPRNNGSYSRGGSRITIDFNANQGLAANTFTGEVEVIVGIVSEPGNSSNNINLYASTGNWPAGQSLSTATVVNLTVSSAIYFPQTPFISTGTNTQATIAFDTASQSFVGGNGNFGPGLIPLVISSAANNDMLVSTTITTNETAFASQITLPANFFNANNIGKTIRITTSMEAIYPASGGPTAALKARFQKSGPTNVYISTMAAITPGLGYTPFAFEFIVTCKSVGTSGSIFSSLTPGADLGSVLFRDQQNALQTIDTTAAQTFQVTLTYGSSVAQTIFYMGNLMITTY